MKDLTNPTWIKLKGLLFLLIGITAAILLFLDNPNWKTCRLARGGDLEFLPVLLFRILRHRKIR